MPDITKLKSVTEEIIGEDTLVRLLDKKSYLRHYIGLEISGNLHIGHAVSAMLVIKELQELGVHCTIFLADWHAWINDKLGGDLKFMDEVGIPLFKELFKASSLMVGADFDKIEFIKASTIVDSSDYWACVIDVAKNTSLARIERSIDILGRKEGESTDFAKLMYPAMQVADIYYMQTHIMHAGMDQRKAHVIALDVAKSLKIKPMIVDGERISPIAIHHHLLLGLTPPSKEVQAKGEVTRDDLTEMKMSKSKPMSAVFLVDTPEVVKEKIMKAFCPEGQVKLNPILDWSKNVCFKLGTKTIDIKRKEEWGGDKTYTTYEELEKDFVEKKLHPMDLKDAVARSLITILEPATKYLDNPKIKELSELVKNKVSR
ncbi:MAG: tyrosine--tRNA ligase [bacterium]